MKPLEAIDLSQRPLRDEHRGGAAGEAHHAPPAHLPGRAHLLDVRPHRVQALHVPAAGATSTASRAASASRSPTPSSGSSTSDGRRVGPDEVGQLVIRGATVMHGYWEKPEATARAAQARPAPGRAGALHRRLLPRRRRGLPVLRRPHGRHHQVRGEKVAPKEVEKVLYDLDEIKEAAVIGVARRDRRQGDQGRGVGEWSGQLDERLVRKPLPRAARGLHGAEARRDPRVATEDRVGKDPSQVG